MLLGRGTLFPFTVDTDFRVDALLELNMSDEDLPFSPILILSGGSLEDDVLRRPELSECLEEESLPSLSAKDVFRVLGSEVETAALDSLPSLMVLGFDVSTVTLLFDKSTVTRALGGGWGLWDVEGVELTWELLTGLSLSRRENTELPPTLPSVGAKPDVSNNFLLFCELELGISS